MPSAVLDLGYGSTLIVVFISCILFGTIVVQAYGYYVNFARDRLGIKLYVAAVLILDMLSTVFAVAWQYNVLIENWGNTDVLFSTNWLLSLNPFFCGLMGLLVHSFFAWRLHIITESWIWPSLIAVFALPAFAGAMGSCISTMIVTTFGHNFSALKGLGVLWLAASALADVTITVVLSYQLRKRRSYFEQTNHLLDRLILGTVQNGLLTALTATTDLILIVIYGSPTHTVSFLIPKLYSNSVLASLNARGAHHLSDVMMHDTEIGTTATKGSTRMGRLSHRISSFPQPQAQVAMICVRSERTQIFDGVDGSRSKSEG